MVVVTKYYMRGYESSDKSIEGVFSDMSKAKGAVLDVISTNILACSENRIKEGENYIRHDDTYYEFHQEFKLDETILDKEQRLYDEQLG